MVLPVAIGYGVLTAGPTSTVYDDSGQTVSRTSGGLVAGLFVATLLTILFRQRYPRWWFDFAREPTWFAARIGASGWRGTLDRAERVSSSSWLNGSQARWVQARPAPTGSPVGSAD